MESSDFDFPAMLHNDSGIYRSQLEDAHEMIGEIEVKESKKR
jgi:hypothetical protein